MVCYELQQSTRPLKRIIFLSVTSGGIYSTLSLKILTQIYYYICEYEQFPIYILQ